MANIASAEKQNRKMIKHRARNRAAMAALRTAVKKARTAVDSKAADATGLVKEAVSIPVVANGELERVTDAPSMLDASGADAVMIGRGAYGRPWIIGQIGSFHAGEAVPASPSGHALLELILEHHETMLSHYGAMQGMRIARKHLGWYLDRFAPAAPAALRAAILTGTAPAAMSPLIRAAFSAPDRRLAA